MKRPTSTEEEVPVEYHLEELAERLKKVLIVFFIVVIIITFVPADIHESYVPIVTVIAKKMANYVLPESINWMGITYNVTLIYTSPFEGFNIIIYTSVLFSLLIISPYIVYHGYCYIAPALYEHEKKRLKSGAITAVILFVFGGLLGYFVLAPITLRIMLILQAAPAPTEQFLISMTFSKLIDFIVKIVVTTGLAFEIPLLIYYLIVFEVIEVERLKGYNSRLAFIIILVIAAIITPDPSGITMFLLAIPYYIVFLIGVHMGEKKLRKEGKL